MAIKPFITEEQYKALPETNPLRAEYARQDDGRYRLTVEETEDGWALENVRGLRNAVEATRQEAGGYKKALKPFVDAGLKPEDVPGVLERAAKYNDLDPKATEAQWLQKFQTWQTDFKAQMDKVHGQEVANISAALEAVRGQLGAELIDNTALRVMAKDTIKGRPALLLPLVKQHARPKTLDDGTMVVTIWDPEKNRERIGTSGGLLTVEEYLLELKGNPEFQAAFDGLKKSGDGAPADGGAGGTGAAGDGKAAKDMSNADKAAYIHKHGLAAWKELLSGSSTTT